MLTLEQYRDPKLAQLYHDYLATGPTEYGGNFPKADGLR